MDFIEGLGNKRIGLLLVSGCVIIIGLCCFCLVTVVVADQIVYKYLQEDRVVSTSIFFPTTPPQATVPVNLPKGTQPPTVSSTNTFPPPLTNTNSPVPTQDPKTATVGALFTLIAKTQTQMAGMITDTAVVVATNTTVMVVPQDTPVPTSPPPGNCDPSYPDFCIEPNIPDLDCKDVLPHKKFTVIQPDPHGFDGDKDGIGCEW